VATSDFRIGSIFGIEIRIDYSWFIIFFLIVWTLVQQFSAAYPGMGQPVALVVGVVTTLLFFMSLLGHELSHSVVARMKGIEVAGITLFIFGGMAHTKMEASRPGDEFQIAGVGPLSSLIIAAVFYAIAVLGATAGWSPAILDMAGYLAFWNAILAIFNLLPGFPLDGGRLFRSAVWKFTGDLDKATRWATAGGKLLGYLLMGLGVLELLPSAGLPDFIQGGLLNGVYLILIGWFLRNAAASAGRQQRVSSLLQQGRADEVMTRNPETVPPGLALDELVRGYFLRRRYEAFPVVDGDARPLGVVSVDHVKNVPQSAWPMRTVRDVMAALDETMVVAPDAGMNAVLDAIRSSGARRALVVRDGRLEGVITASDVNAWLRRVQELGRA
jgi:Zn-dependent protease/predicted transcriptional regulator